MKHLLLERFLESEHGTFGTLAFADEHSPLLYTCEDEWRDNAARVSCIPEGEYALKRARYHKGGYDTYEVTNVPGRGGILIHAGNTEEHTEGCILLGMNLGVVRVERDEESGKPAKKQAVVRSKIAHDLFMKTMAGDGTAKLTVQWAQRPGASR